MKISKIIILICILMIASMAVSATTYDVLYKDPSDSHVESYMRFSDEGAAGGYGPDILTLKGNLDTFSMKYALFDPDNPLTSDEILMLHLRGRINNSHISMAWYLQDGEIYSLGHYIGTAESSELTVTEPGTFGYGNTTSDITLLSGLQILNPAENSLAESVLIQDGDEKYSFEIDSLAQVGPALYIHASKNDGIEIGEIKTNEVWIHALTEEEATAIEKEAATEEEVVKELVEEAGVTEEEAETLSEERTNHASAVYGFEQMLLLEKAIDKTRTTTFYFDNKAEAEPLLKDIEAQITILKKVSKNSLGSKEATSTPGSMTPAKPAEKRGWLSRFGFAIFELTGKAWDIKSLLATKKANTATTGPTAAEEKSKLPPADKTAAVTSPKKTLTQSAAAKGMLVVMENRIEKLAECEVFSESEDAQEALTKIRKDIDELKELAGFKTAQTTSKVSRTPEPAEKEKPAVSTPAKRPTLTARLASFLRR